jgi:glycosyltransferase involved in cell wall biosynthesis
MSDVTVAIPVRDGAATLAGTLAALARQSVAHELLICDSGSLDASVSLARAHGARVLEIPESSFSHGGTRNLLMREAHGAHVALLTQDAEPADEHWLEQLLGGFALADDVAIVCGPYRPRPAASPAVRIELDRWFDSLSPDAMPSVERLAQGERALPAIELVGRRGFFTDANACIAHAAWERVPFREVAYAEDRVLALDMLRAGYAKAFVPAAAVLHSHDYTPVQELRRCFDEWRGLREVYGWREPARPAQLARKLRGELAAARRARIHEELEGAVSRHPTLAALSHHILRLIGAVLGSRADRLPPLVRRGLSLERRSGFTPLDLDAPTAGSSMENQSQ